MKKGQLLVSLLILFAVLLIPIPTGVRADPTPTLILNPNYGSVDTLFHIDLNGTGYPDVACTLGSDPGMSVGPLLCTITGGVLSGSIDLLAGNLPGTYLIKINAPTTIASAQFFLYPSTTVTKTQTTTILSTAESTTTRTVTNPTTVTVATTTTVPTTATSTSWQTITANTTIGSTVVVPTTVTTIVSTTPTTTYGISTFYTATSYGIFTSYYFTTISYGTTTSLYAIGTTTLYGLSTQTVYTDVTPQTLTNTHTKTEQYTTTVGGVLTTYVTETMNTTALNIISTETRTQTFTEEEDVTQTVTVATVTVQPPQPTPDVTWIYILTVIIVGAVVLIALWKFELLPEMPDFISGIPERLGGIFRRKKPAEEEEIIEEPTSPAKSVQCSNCQTVNAPETIYCTVCGVKLGSPKPEEPKEQKEPEPEQS